MPIVFEKEFENAVQFITDILKDVRVIIFHFYRKNILRLISERNNIG